MASIYGHTRSDRTLSTLPIESLAAASPFAWRRLVLAGLSAAGLLTGGCTLEAPPATPSASASSDSGSAGRSTPGDTVATVSQSGEAKPSADKSASRPELTLGGVRPAVDDTLLANYHDDPDTLNPITRSDTVSETLQRNVYERLAQRNYHNPDEWEPALAESWEFDKDKLEFTLHLRKGVKWHPMTLPSGKVLPAKEFTARDVKFTFDCILNKNIEAPHLRSYYEDPEAEEESQRYKIKVSVVDDHTVKVRWTKPYFLADAYTLDVPMMPRHVFSVDEQGDPISFDFGSKEFADGFNNHWANKRMCGTGALIFKEWKKGDGVTFERNPDYWGPPFAFSRLVQRCVTNNNTAVQLVLQNELDWSVIPEKDAFLQSADNANVKAGKTVLEEYSYPAYRYVGYNEKFEFFKDKRVRWAMSHAIPVDQIIEKVYHGLAERLTGPFLPGTSTYNDSLELVTYDLGKSRELLDAAGWKDTDGDGVRDKEIDGKQVPAQFDLMIFSDSQQYLTIGEIIKENCRQIGVDARISPAKWALMLQKLRKQEFEACILGWGMDWKNDPFQIFHSSQADVPDSSNHIGYKNPETDRLIEQLRVALEPDEQARIAKQIHRAIYDDQPMTFLFREKVTAGRDGRLDNVKFYKIMPGYDVREWFGKTPRIAN
jgi:ABC-type transport system substrate-binding protein